MLGINAGIPRSPESNRQGRPLPLDEGRKLYEKHIARPKAMGGTRESTQRRYKVALDNFIPFAKSKGVSVWNGVTGAFLSTYAAHRESKGRADRTILGELKTIKQAFKWLTEAEHLKGVKPLKIEIPKSELQPACCYRTEEVLAMIALCQANEKLGWLADVIIALAHMGVRISELVSVRWSDIDLTPDRLELTLTDESGRPRKPGSHRRQLKSGRSRSVPLHPNLLTVLKRLPMRDAYVFHGLRGERINSDMVRQAFVRHVITPLAKQFPTPEGERGFEHGRLHTFRHYFCSTCANNGVPEPVLMKWLGHADSKMVRHYYHLDVEESQRWIQQTNFLGETAGRPDGNKENNPEGEDRTQLPETDATENPEI